MRATIPITRQTSGMAPHDVHLIDGTYELYRHHHALPSHRVNGVETAALRGVVRSLVGLLEDGATHVGVATDHVIESFRNDLWAGYKTGAGVPDDLRVQFTPLETTLAACGFLVWPTVEVEADDALAAAARVADADPAVRRVLIATPDKDLAQCVRGDRVVQWDRRRDLVRTDRDVVDRYGVPPSSIPHWLALVGDAADGFPGVPGWGAKSAAIVLARYGTIDAIPPDDRDWEVTVRGAKRLAASLADHRADARLFLRLATLRDDAPVLPGGVEQLRWRGPTPALAEACRSVDLDDLPERLDTLATARGGP